MLTPRSYILEQKKRKPHRKRRKSSSTLEGGITLQNMNHTHANNPTEDVNQIENAEKDIDGQLKLISAEFRGIVLWCEGLSI